MTPASEFHALLTPTQREPLCFQATSLALPAPTIFGGQLMAQALSAAAATLDEPRPAHHLQANFVAPGDPQGTLEFEVMRIRDGKSTSHRQVHLTQQGRTLLTVSVSFQQPAQGFEHQVSMPVVEQPEELLQSPDCELTFSADNAAAFPFLILNCPQRPGDDSHQSSVWAKPRSEVAANALLHQMLFTFFSDATILQSALRPHNLDWENADLVVATMNHSIWFHRPFDVNEWLLLHSESPSTGSGRALSVANAFVRSGALVASIAQEGLLRPR